MRNRWVEAEAAAILTVRDRLGESFIQRSNASLPTASSAAFQAVCDALAITLPKHGQLTAEEYAFLHPGGKLRRSVHRIKDVMRSGDANPLVHEIAVLSDTVVAMTKTPGRPGAANVVDDSGRPVGIFTDGDLRRLLERRMLDLETPVRALMSTEPRCVGPEELVLTSSRSVCTRAVRA